jgi:hypothetical protein
MPKRRDPPILRQAMRLIFSFILACLLATGDCKLLIAFDLQPWQYFCGHAMPVQVGILWALIYFGLRAIPYFQSGRRAL